MLWSVCQWVVPLAGLVCTDPEPFPVAHARFLRQAHVWNLAPEADDRVIRPPFMAREGDGWWPQVEEALRWKEKR